MVPPSVVPSVAGVAGERDRRVKQGPTAWDDFHPHPRALTSKKRRIGCHTMEHCFPQN